MLQGRNVCSNPREFLLCQFKDLLARSTTSRTTTGGRRTKPDTFGFAPIDSLLQTISRQGRIHKACILAQYFTEMHARLGEFHACLPSGGYCIMVVGDSRTGDLRIPTARTLRWLAEKSGFAHIRTSRYKIRNGSMQFPVKPHPKIAEESIVVLRRVKG
jgi:hypothetical protein